SLLLAVGWWDRTAAVGLSYLGACFFVRSPLVASAWLPLAGWLLLVHTCLPPAPYGSVAALGRVDPAGAWRMPPLIFGAAWIVMAFGYSGGGYAKLLSRSWVDGVWTVSALELLFAPLALGAPTGPGSLARPRCSTSPRAWAVSGARSRSSFAPCLRRCVTSATTPSRACGFGFSRARPRPARCCRPTSAPDSTRSLVLPSLV